MRLVDISDERFWKILFDEACVEGQQADRIEKELEKITAYDIEAVVEQIKEWNKVTGALPEHSTWYYELISIIERGGVK